ncbi:MAG: hypothetical protein F6K17_32735 [Okeania sp. SIO3C4]|nr:hypothetical protein [Okeania sp. SIO3C4]
MNAIRMLTINQQTKLLEFVLSFVEFNQQQPSLLEFAGSISPEDVQLMENAIEEDCNKIDYDEW